MLLEKDHLSKEQQQKQSIHFNLLETSILSSCYLTNNGYANDLVHKHQ